MEYSTHSDTRFKGKSKKATVTVRSIPIAPERSNVNTISIKVLLTASGKRYRLKCSQLEFNEKCTLLMMAIGRFHLLFRKVGTTLRTLCPCFSYLVLNELFKNL